MKNQAQLRVCTSYSSAVPQSFTKISYFSSEKTNVSTEMAFSTFQLQKNILAKVTHQRTVPIVCKIFVEIIYLSKELVINFKEHKILRIYRTSYVYIVIGTSWTSRH